jgi:hypothetical protein
MEVMTKPFQRFARRDETVETVPSPNGLILTG